ncbi:Aromatic prenyltransferase, DMATS type [Actinobacteria bacterium OK074]|nr:Aromatic prenyltransferase, DMATS type [Actinobacteria bacterium OK074]
MITSRTGGLALPATDTLGGFTAAQLLRLCDVVGLGQDDAETYAQVLSDSLGAVSGRPLDLSPPSPTFLSDDHTPVEYSLSFVPGAAPSLRVLVEPGCAAAGLKANGRTGLRAIRTMAGHWGFGTEQLDLLEDLFLPPSPAGPLALWCALELRPGGTPKLKVYLNPSARGADRAAETIGEALTRLGHKDAFAALPPADGYPFFALDLGDWAAPRLKIYLRHNRLSAADVGGLCRLDPGPSPEVLEDFLRVAAGFDTPDRVFGSSPYDAQLTGRPGLTCHSFTETTVAGPTGFTLHIPVRDYVRDDAEAHERAVALLARHGMDTTTLGHALAAVTERRPEDGSGLIAYLALAHEQGRPPRVTAYISSEAYAVRLPQDRPGGQLPLGALSSAVQRASDPDRPSLT